MLVGLSFSRCVKEIVDGKVGADEGRHLEEKRIYIGDIVIHT